MISIITVFGAKWQWPVFRQITLFRGARVGNPCSPFTGHSNSKLPTDGGSHGKLAGGGIYAQASAGSSSTTDSKVTLTLSNNHIVKNSSWGNGGGVYTYAYTSSNTGSAMVDITLTNNRIAENNACSSGGGVYIYSSANSSYTKRSVTRFGLTGNNINGNYSTNGGGAYIILSYTDTVNGGVSSFIETNEINGNQAFSSYGAISLYYSNTPSSALRIANNVISGNYNQSVSGAGGVRIASYLSSPTISFINNTISRNTGEALTAYSDGSGGEKDNFVLNLYNNILFSNHLPSSTSNEILLVNYSLPRFSGPVDVYVGLFIPRIDPNNVYQIGSDLSLNTSNTPVPWRSGLTVAVESSLFGDLNLSGSPRFECFLYLIVVPQGASVNGARYYEYRTSFIFG